jgi:antitoxin component of MazEF toxin-antitoxin module
MAVQSIFQAGNSSVVSIPTELVKEMSLTVGQKVSIEKVSDSAILIKTNPNKSKTRDKEFELWLKRFVEEDKELLIELSNR